MAEEKKDSLVELLIHLDAWGELFWRHEGACPRCRIANITIEVRPPFIRFLYDGESMWFEVEDSRVGVSFPRFPPDTRITLYRDLQAYLRRDRSK